MVNMYISNIRGIAPGGGVIADKFPADFQVNSGIKSELCALIRINILRTKDIQAHCMWGGGGGRHGQITFLTI